MHHALLVAAGEATRTVLVRAPTEPIRAVVFDVGETIVDETRAWSQLADRAGVTRLTLAAALGALIERGDDHRLAWGLLGIERPVVDDAIEEADLYPDAVPTLHTLRKAGYLLGLAGNQPAGAEAALHRLDLPVDLVASSARWGIEKPSPAFFGRISAALGLPPSQIAYVGDRLDNDVLPARAAGMLAIFVRRGPWGYVHASRPEARLADARIETLAELPALLAALP
jgi:HAD superfamily hydrolase (TIGR01509 family)